MSPSFVNVGPCATPRKVKTRTPSGAALYPHYSYGVPYVAKKIHLLYLVSCRNRLLTLLYRPLVKHPAELQFLRTEKTGRVDEGEPS